MTAGVLGSSPAMNYSCLFRFFMVILIDRVRGKIRSFRVFRAVWDIAYHSKNCKRFFTIYSKNCTCYGNRLNKEH